MDKITLGEFIERQIKQRNLSGREFADLLDVPHSSVVRYRRHEPGNAHHTPLGASVRSRTTSVLASPGDKRLMPLAISDSPIFYPFI